MPQPVAVLTADLHVDQAAWGNYPSLRGDAEYSLAQIVDYCRQHRVPQLVAAGDLFDSQKTRSYPYDVWWRQLDRLHEAGIAFRFIEGNHDYDDPPKLARHPAAVSSDRATFALGPFTAYALSFRAAADLAEELARAPRTDWLITHQGWKELQGPGGTQGSLAQVVSAPNLFTGDLHLSFCRGYLVPHGQLRVVSPGSTCMQSITEPADKWFVVLRDDGTVTREPLRTRPVLDAALATADEVRAFAAGLPRALEQCAHALPMAMPAAVTTPIVRVVHTPDVSAALGLISAAAAGSPWPAHLFFVSRGAAVNSDVPDAPLPGDPVVAQNSSEQLLALLREAIPSAEGRDLAERLYRADSVRDAYRAWRQQVLGIPS